MTDNERVLVLQRHLEDAKNDIDANRKMLKRILAQARKERRMTDAGCCKATLNVFIDMIHHEKSK